MQSQSKTIHLALFLLACLAGVGCSTTGNGDIVTRTLTVTGFTKVKSIMPINMTITEGANFTFTASTDSNLQSLLTANTVGDTLEVGSNGRISPTATSSIQITLPEFRGATLTNSGDVDISGIATGRDLDFLHSGAAELTFTGSANLLKAELQGIGSMALSGSATNLEATLSGHTQIDAQPLSATNVRLVTTDPTSTGAIIATVNGGTAFISLGGAGDITLHGNPSSIEQSDTGGGSIILIP